MCILQIRRFSFTIIIMMTKMKPFGFAIALFFLLSISSARAQNESEIYEKGLQALKSENYELAKKTFYTLRSQYPQNANYWYLSGVSKIQLKDHSSALVDLNKAISLNTELSDAYLFRHLANKETRNFQFALADISKYLEYSPNDTSARWSRYSLALYMKEFEEAVQDGNWLMDKGLGGDSLLISQISLLEESGNYRMAIDLTSQIIRKNPDKVQGYYKRAFLYFTAAEHEKSLQDIERFLLSEPKNINALKLRFDNHFYLRNLPTCEKYVIELIELEPKNGTFHGDLGHVLLQKGDWERAEAAFEKAIKFKSESLGYIYLGRGIARFNKGDKAAACSDWERALILGEMVSRNYLIKYCNR